MKHANLKMYKIIGKNIEKIRKSKGWTVNYAAKKASLGRSHLKSIEDGKCETTIRIIYKIAEGWQVPITDIVKTSKKKTQQRRGKRRKRRTSYQERMNKGLCSPDR